MHRFYCPQSNFSSKNVIIADVEELHHLRDVLRLKKGAKITLFDGKGTEATGNLTTVTSKHATVQLNDINHFLPKKPALILACALPKKSKFEQIIEKATELGVDEIVPLQTHRTEVKLQGARLIAKRLRYQQLAVSASKQSGRSILPVVHPVTDFTSALRDITSRSVAMIPSLEENRQHLLSVIKNIKFPDAVSFFIGPEGDFTPLEYAQARERGCVPVSLGRTVLKVETAAVCALSIANLFYHAA